MNSLLFVKCEKAWGRQTLDFVYYLYIHMGLLLKVVSLLAEVCEFVVKDGLNL